MSLPERPKLRGLLAYRPDGRQRQFVIWDYLRVSNAEICINDVELACLHLFDGERTLPEIQAALSTLAGESLPAEAIDGLARRVYRAEFLDGPVRKAACVRGDPALLR